MSVSAATLRLLIDAGLEGDALVAVVASIDADMEEQAEARENAAPARTARQERNRRYYEKRLNGRLNASEKRLNSDADVDLAPLDGPPSPEPLPPLNPPTRSEANASGAFAPSNEFEEDDRTRLFGPARYWLEKQTGQSTKQIRSLQGRWLKIVGDDATAVLEVIRRAKDLNVAEPIAWIEAALRGSMPAAVRRDDGVTDQYGNRIDWDARASFFAKTGLWLDEWGDPRRSIPAEHRSKFSKLMEAA